MRLISGIALGVLGVLVVLGSLLAAFTGAMFDVLAIGTGNSIAGPERAEEAPDAVFLLGVPVGVALAYAGWRVGKSDSPH